MRSILAYGCHLTAVDGNVTAYTTSTILPVIITAADACSVPSARRIHYATIDCYSTAVGVTIVTAYTCTTIKSSATAMGIDDATVDDERTHPAGTDARLVVVTVIDGQRPRAFDVQSVARAQFDALRGGQRGALAEDERHGAADGDAVRNRHVLIYHVYAIRQCGHVGSEGSALCHHEV